MNILIGILLIGTAYSSFSQQQTQQQNWIKGGVGTQSVQLQPIEYLSNVLTLDIILQFLENNKTVPLDKLESVTKSMIAYERKSGEENVQIKREEHQVKLEELQRFDCWLCTKQFKNSSYLAMHYAIKHTHTLRKAQYHKAVGDEIQQNDSRPRQTIQQILSQWIYKRVHAHQLNVVFNSQAPPQSIYRYCFNLLSGSMAGTKDHVPAPSKPKLNRYALLGTQDNIRELCTIISMKMHKRSIQLSIFKSISIMILVIGALGWISYFVPHLYQQLEDQTPKSKMH